MKNGFFKKHGVRLLNNTCRTFTVTLLLFYSIGALIVNDRMTMNFSTALLSLGYSLVFSLGLLVFRSESLNTVLKLLIHYAVAAGGFVLLFIVVPGNNKSGELTLMLVIVFTLLYVVCAAVALMLSSARKKKKSETEDYSPVYDRSKQS